MTESQAEDILFSTLPAKQGYVGSILLNRPRALNALTTHMCRELGKQLLAWQQDDSVCAVIIRSQDSRAFCAGGDVRALYDHGRNNLPQAQEFFHTEYRMNSILHHFTKPYIAFLDGITMGGGIGISIHGSHPVATEKLIWAMPETTIGFFPDVGGGYFLNHCRDKIGYYLGLTGQRIRSADALQAGFVHQVIASDQQEALLAALLTADLSQDAHAEVTAVIERYKIDPGKAELTEHYPDIADCFSKTNVEDVFACLNEKNNPWSQATLDILKTKSPLSLKLTLMHLCQAADLTFDEIMQSELNIALECLSSHDFYEGVRSVLVDKDQKPQWCPVNLQDVTQANLQPFFRDQYQLQPI